VKVEFVFATQPHAPEARELARTNCNSKVGSAKSRLIPYESQQSQPTD